jgi:hypothetical protein
MKMMMMQLIKTHCFYIVDANVVSFLENKSLQFAK